MTESEKVTIKVDYNDTFDPVIDNDKCLGTFPFTKIFQEVGIYKFLKQQQLRLKVDDSFTSILELLVFGRLLIPCSDKTTYEQRDFLFDSKYMNISFDDINDALNHFNKYKDALQKLIWKNTRKLYSRDVSTCYCYITSYSFQSKSKDPGHNIHMGLVMDGTGIPLAYEFLSENNSNQTALIQKFKLEYGAKKVIIVVSSDFDSLSPIVYNDHKEKRKLSNQEIKDIIRTTQRIKDAFQVSKSSIKEYPIYAWDLNHINAHFLTSYLALVVITLLEKKLNDQYSSDEILDALRNYKCSPLNANYYLVSHKDAFIDIIGNAFDLDLSLKNMSREFIEDLLTQ